MPRGDGTGPTGAGPRTGRGMGYCNGYPNPGQRSNWGGLGGLIGFGRWTVNALPRLARGLGRGAGKGSNRRF